MLRSWQGLPMTKHGVNKICMFINGCAVCVRCGGECCGVQACCSKIVRSAFWSKGVLINGRAVLRNTKEAFSFNRTCSSGYYCSCLHSPITIFFLFILQKYDTISVISDTNVVSDKISVNSDTNVLSLAVFWQSNIHQLYINYGRISMRVRVEWRLGYRQCTECDCEGEFSVNFQGIQ